MLEPYIKPKVVVLLIGTNNTGVERGSGKPRNLPPETIEGIKADVRAIRGKLADTKILLLAIFPRGEKPDHPQRLQIKEINAAIAGLHDGKRVFFLDIGPKFLSPDGTLSRAVMPDFLHPNDKGYEIWAKAIEQPLKDLLQ